MYVYTCRVECYVCCVFFQAEDGIRDLVRSRGLGDVYKRQGMVFFGDIAGILHALDAKTGTLKWKKKIDPHPSTCLLYTSDAADERSSVDLGGRRIIKKKKNSNQASYQQFFYKHIAASSIRAIHAQKKQNKISL